MLHRLNFAGDRPTVEQIEEIRFSELPFREGAALERDLEDLIAENVNLIDPYTDLLKHRQHVDVPAPGFAATSNICLSRERRSNSSSRLAFTAWSAPRRRT